ncbi:tetratricopeptide repeat protein [Aquimarina sp. 2201CG5-10]|uniref:tetratricopeptide repeat protein n=1 Tax=Aquimarina callyspongiae TaxID=3098150 RepID=UPI002AB5A75F|nr:tetratricopeptide repeat protein [Aquimarina sp. 2201CG5-10]MDY8138036.1 tetratricopeptide repeat protein [Aquimarina sp. 2201CG5-10]
MKTSFTFIITLFFSLACFSQSSDSLVIDLKLKIEEAITDSARIEYKIELIEKMRRFDSDTSRIIINDVLKQLEEIQSSELYYKKNKAQALNYLGIIDSKRGNAENALKNYLRALDISEAIKDSVTIGFSLHNLGMFYRRQKGYEKSKQYFKNAIAIKEKLTDVESLAVSHHMLAITYYANKQNDSSLIHILKVKALPCSKTRLAKVNGTLAAIHYSNKEFDKAIAIYNENIGISKGVRDQSELSISYLNVAVLYNALKEYEKALPYLDSAITIAQEQKNKGLLLKQYYSRSNLNETRKEYQQALQDYKTYKVYHDSINDTEKAKRITALELNHKFEKEKQANELQLENETSRKQLYLLLFVIATVMGGVIFWLTKKNAKQRLELTKNRLEREQLDKVKAELSLVTKENELKKVVIENSLRQEVLSKTLGEIKDIIKLENEKERKTALQSLSASLLSEKVAKNNSTDLKSYLNKVNLDFKVILDNNFSKLNEKEKELLCLMTLGLNATQISKLQNNTVSAIKSSRSRIRKKIGVDSKMDIIEFIRNFNNKE